MQLQKSRNVVQVSKAILSSRMASSNIIKTFGIISDIQYADAEDATDFRLNFFIIICFTFHKNSLVESKRDSTETP